MTTLREIVNAQPALQRLAAERLPVRTAYRLKKNLDQLDRELRTYEKLRGELIQRLGRATENGGWEIPLGDQEAIAAFTAELNELLDCETEIALRPMPVGELGSIQMTAGDLMLVGWLFEDDEPAPA